MDYTQVKDMQARFDGLVRRVRGESIEFWFARDLQELLGYDSWVSFSIAMRRGINACGATEYDAANHFRRVARVARLGDEVACEVEDFMLTRYACYLIAWNGDSRRMTIVFAQSYFSIQTRKQKLVNDRMRLQALIDARACVREARPCNFERGVDDEDFARIRARGDSALFGSGQELRSVQPQDMTAGDIKNLARRLKGELRELVRDFLTIS